jgi:glucose-1-phosphate cytidylyltransferase
MIKEYFLNYEAMNNDFTICLGANNRINYNDSHAEQDFSVTLADTGLNTMTGGRVRRIAKYLDDDLFMVTYGLCDVDISDVLKFHRSHGKAATVTAVRPIVRFGTLTIGPTSAVERFAEKPVAEGWINAGFFVFSRKVLEFLDDDECILERTPLEKLAEQGELVAYQHRGFFFAMDTYREYALLNEMWNKGDAPWKVWE